MKKVVRFNEKGEVGRIRATRRVDTFQAEQKV